LKLDGSAKRQGESREFRAGSYDGSQGLKARGDTRTRRIGFRLLLP
jgi:hypothetical protein